MKKQDIIERLYVDRQITMSEAIEMRDWDTQDVLEIYRISKEVKAMQNEKAQ